MLGFIDSHCHLSMQELAEQRQSVLEAMSRAKVQGALNVCTTLEEFDSILAVTQQEQGPQLWASVGVHPQNEGVIEPSVDDLVRCTQHKKVVAIGETGLDYYWNKENKTAADWQWQRDRFKVHLEAALLTELPIIIHTREASEDTLSILHETWLRSGKKLKGVFHCFTETQAVAEAALAMGFYISFSGILTFKNAQDLRTVAQNTVPLERLLIETDSPYLAPVPHRGKVNQPSWVVYVAQELAKLKNLSLEQIANQTSQNFFELFHKAHIDY